jgi:hypothetical protein
MRGSFIGRWIEGYEESKHAARRARRLTREAKRLYTSLWRQAPEGQEVALRQERQ